MVVLRYDPKYAGMNSYEIYDSLQEGLKQMKGMDVHLDDGTGGGLRDDEGKGPQRSQKPLTAEERKELQDEIKQAVLQAAQSAGNDVPDIKRMIKELTEPKLSLERCTTCTDGKSESLTLHLCDLKRPQRSYIPGMNKDEELLPHLHWTCPVVLMMKLLRRCLVKHMVLCNNMIATRLLYYVLTQVPTMLKHPLSEDGKDVREYLPLVEAVQSLTLYGNIWNKKVLSPFLLIMFTDGYPGIVGVILNTVIHFLL